MAAPPWAGALAVRGPADEVVLLSDSTGAVYAQIAPDGTSLGGRAIEQLTDSMETCVKRGDIKLPKSQDLKRLFESGESGPFVADPRTGEVKPFRASDNELMNGKQFNRIFEQVESSMWNSQMAGQAASGALPGAAHPQGGYMSRSGEYYPPAPQREKQISYETSAGPTFKHASFSWRTIYHPFVSTIENDPKHLKDVKVLAEVCMTPTPLRMYTDHRVMMNIVLPGVSHISLAAATASVGVEGKNRMGRNDFVIHVMEVMFERPYMIHAGTEEIKFIEANGMEKAQAILAPITYCTCEKGVEKEYVTGITDKNPKLELAWAP